MTIDSSINMYWGQMPVTDLGASLSVASFWNLVMADKMAAKLWLGPKLKGCKRKGGRGRVEGEGATDSQKGFRT